MASCEKCWDDAKRLMGLTGIDVVDAYNKLLKERESAPCSPKDQAGQFWDEQLQIDKRLI